MRLLLVRHSNTKFNNPAEERIRGYSDVPINEDGVAHVEQASKFLKDFPIQRVFSSNLQRAIRSATIIAEPHSAQVIPKKGLLPWNVGKIQGLYVKEAAPLLDRYQSIPDLRVPDGESYREFYNRWSAALLHLISYAEAHPDECVVAVTHSRNLLALPSILGKTGIGDVPVKGGPPPASVTLVRMDEDTGDYCTEVIFQLNQLKDVSNS